MKDCVFVLETNDNSRNFSSCSIAKTSLRSSIRISSINSSQHEPDSRNDDDNFDNASDTASVTHIANPDPPIIEDKSFNELPFENDQFPSKTQTTASGKKAACEVFELFIKQPDGTFKCILCQEEPKVTSFAFLLK